MKLGLVTKLDKRNTGTLKKYDDDDMSTNCNVVVVFRFTAFQSRIARLVCKIYIFINRNLLSSTSMKIKKFTKNKNGALVLRVSCELHPLLLYVARKLISLSCFVPYVFLAMCLII